MRLKLLLVVAFPETVNPPEAPFIVILYGDEFPSEIVFPATLPFITSVEVPALNTAELENEPPIVSAA
jgi:hypothetical protein